jgi:hypothetical protein
MWRGLLCACLGAGWATTALAGSAEDLRNDWSGEYGMNRNLSVTVSPLSLLDARAPTLDVTGELRTSETRSVAITSSMSLQHVLREIGAKRDREVGLQLRDYVVGTFDNGLFLGGQVGFTNPDLLRLSVDRTRFGPMAGMKVSLSLFTIEGRAGAWLGMGDHGRMSIEPSVDFATGFTF